MAFEVTVDDRNHVLYDCVVFLGWPEKDGAKIRKNGECLNGQGCMDLNSVDTFFGQAPPTGGRSISIASRAENKALVRRLAGVHRVDSLFDVHVQVSCEIGELKKSITARLKDTWTSSECLSYIFL